MSLGPALARDGCSTWAGYLLVSPAAEADIGEEQCKEGHGDDQGEYQRLECDNDDHERQDDHRNHVHTTPFPGLSRFGYPLRWRSNLGNVDTLAFRVPRPS